MSLWEIDKYILLLSNKGKIISILNFIQNQSINPIKYVRSKIVVVLLFIKFYTCIIEYNKSYLRNIFSNIMQ